MRFIYSEKTSESEAIISFDLQINSLAENREKDDDFLEENEIFMLTVGEEGKFSAESFYQNKLTIRAVGKELSVYGYAPDFNRTGNAVVLPDGEKPKTGEKYSFKVVLTKRRVYIYLNGALVESYGNARETVDGYAFFVRNGENIEISGVGFASRDEEDYPIDEVLMSYVEKGLFGGYLSYDKTREGLIFNRLNVKSCFECTTRNFYAYDSGLMLDAETDASAVKLDFKVTDIPVVNWNMQFGFAADGRRITQPIKLVNRGEYVSVTMNNPFKDGKRHRLTVFFPMSCGLALTRAEFLNATFAESVKKDVRAIFIGDSITEGSECFDPSRAYPNALALRYGLNALNQSIGGMSFGDYCASGDYPDPFDVAVIALGTNSFCGGTGDKAKTLKTVAEQAEKLVKRIGEKFPGCRIYGLLPIWRSDEDGVNFSLKDTSRALRSVYSRLNVRVIDCHDFVPKDYGYFSDPNFAIHPNSEGHDFYAENLIAAIDKKYKKI